ncbi:MAG TPA: rhodanese-like domain-containing protein [Bacteroidales bacterium]|nr:rhodanese-like domain-containing protein [Bacteroidales bacterium]
MKTRVKYSIGLISIGIILAILPYNGQKALIKDPESLLKEVLNEDVIVTPDQVARMIVNENPDLRLIDLRPENEFRSFSLPGAVNVPYDMFIKNDPAAFLGGGNTKNILYSNGNSHASYALVIARGMKHQNVYYMKDGMNGWYSTVLESKFSGDRISARENTLFETRTKASKLFYEINSLPDSLKSRLIEAKRLEAKKLDGGCE